MSEDALDEVQEPRGEEGRFAATWQNKAAGRALRAARRDAKQSDFAAALSRELGIPISTTALSGWETGRRQVPAPVWVAAAMASSQSLDALLAESGTAEAVGWAEGLGLPQRMESHETDIRDLKAELAAMRQQYADFQNDVRQTLSRAGLPDVPRQTGRETRRERKTAG
jgi:transcriptional regulator with XRE-family HTH domain